MRTPRLILIGAIATLALAVPVADSPGAGGASDRGPTAGKQGSSRTDRNRDRIPDRWERRFHLSLTVNQARRDQDRDHMRNLMEFRTGNNPRDADSDDDGVHDDDENAGRIIAFEGGVLTIGLAGGGELVGTVTEATEIECKTPAVAPDPVPPVSGANVRHADDDEDDDGEDSHHGGGDDEGDDDHGDHSGPGSPNSGPGHGDDHPGDDGDDGDGDDDPEDDEDDEARCTTAELTPGTAVHEAEISAGAGGVVYTEIELIASPSAPPSPQT